MSIFEQVETARADRREMMVYGPIDTVMAHDVSSAIEHYASLNKKPITITMNTPGGSVVDGLSIYDSIKRVTAKGIKVRIIATGACMSMGTIILQAATERLSTPHTAFLLHELSMINIGTLGQQKDRRSTNTFSFASLRPERSLRIPLSTFCSRSASSCRSFC